jgi:hypothetical protein
MELPALGVDGLGTADSPPGALCLNRRSHSLRTDWPPADATPFRLVGYAWRLASSLRLGGGS